MAATSDPARDVYLAQLSAALQNTSEKNSVRSDREKDRAFELWQEYAAELNIPVTLQGIGSKELALCHFIVFGWRYRHTGRRGVPVRADTVGKVLQGVGQSITHLGGVDPRKRDKDSSALDPLFSAFIESMRRQDDPQTRAYPANLTILRKAREMLDFRDPVDGNANIHVMDLMVVGFFWLLRPAEYLDTDPTARSQSFRLQDISFTIDGKYAVASTLSLNEAMVKRIQQATLTFVDQKNAVKGEAIGHKPTNDPFFCPCRALGRIALRLQRRRAPAYTPLHCFYGNDNRLRTVPAQWVTNALRIAAYPLEEATGIKPSLLSARSLRPGGATALLLAGENADTIKLMGRWKSDAMLRYLRVATATGPLAQRMLDQGEYTFRAGVYHKDNLDILPEQVPPAMTHILQNPELLADYDGS